MITRIPGIAFALQTPERLARRSATLMTAFEPWLNLVDHLLGVRLARVLVPCVGASAVACSIVTVETLLGGRTRQWYLVYNLILAWIPLLFAWLCHHLFRAGRTRSLAFWGSAAGWLLFLPNAPYLLTDLVHLLGKSLPHFWPDMIKILLFAITGMLVGMVSLQLMHGMVTQRRGWLAGWGFVAMVSTLCSVGVSLGRFRRWNSWDALHDPQSILRDALDLTKNPYVSNTTGWFFVLFSLLLFSSYAMFYALRHAPTVQAHGAERALLEEEAKESAPLTGSGPDT